MESMHMTKIHSHSGLPCFSRIGVDSSMTSKIYKAAPQPDIDQQMGQVQSAVQAGRGCFLDSPLTPCSFHPPADKLGKVRWLSINGVLMGFNGDSIAFNGI